MLLQGNTELVLPVLSALQASLIMVAGVLDNTDLPFFLFTGMGTTISLGTQIYMLDLDVPMDCLRSMAKGNWLVAISIESGLLGQYLLQYWL